MTNDYFYFTRKVCFRVLFVCFPSVQIAGNPNGRENNFKIDLPGFQCICNRFGMDLLQRKKSIFQLQVCRKLGFEDQDFLLKKNI